MKKNKTQLAVRMERFLDEQRLSCKYSTLQPYRVALKSFSSFLILSCRSKKITSRHIRQLTRPILFDYLRFLHDKKLSAWSRINYFLVVRKYLIWEAERGTIKPRILDGFDRSVLPKPPDCLPRPLSPDTDRLIMNRLRNSDHPYAPCFLLLRLTGMRIGELINLPVDCIHTTAENEVYLKVPLGKMNNERLVPLNQEAINCIDKIKTSFPLCKSKPDPLRLIGIKGNVHNVYDHLHTRFNQILGALSDQNKPVTFHRLRHTYATTLLAGGVSIVSIMKLLGHRRIEMSLRYAGVTPTHLRYEYFRALKTLEKMWSPQHEQYSVNHCVRVTPADLIDCLYAFLAKESALDSNDRKKLLKRLSRLKTALEIILPSQKIPVIP